MSLDYWKYLQDPEKFLPSTGYLSTYIEPLNIGSGFENVSFWIIARIDGKCFVFYYRLELIQVYLKGALLVCTMIQ